MQAVTITKLKLTMSNAYVVRGERTILVDSGVAKDEPKLRRALAAAGLQVQDLALLVHTHGHSDHVGSSASLQRDLEAPTAIHQADDAMARAGKNSIGAPTSLEARLLTPFVDRPFPPVASDLVLTEELDLAPYGVAGRILFTPGHTPGSLSVVLDDGAAIVGDLLMGGYLGGALAGTRPRYHYFVTDRAQVHAGVRRLLELGVHTFYVGHGGPLTAQEVQAWLEEKVGGG
jgi:glyoxylase-like metal-dependent hydrolase (beta-lactamase superfamily II)